MIKDDEASQVVTDNRLDDIFFAKQVNIRQFWFFLQIIIVYILLLLIGNKQCLRHSGHPVGSAQCETSRPETRRDVE